jgi:phage terminase small subunit
MGKLTFKRQVFIEEYLKCWNATEAARRVGYKYPRRQGSRLLSFVDIQAEIERRITEKAMGADEVLLRLAEQARCEYSDYIDSDGAVDLGRLKADGKMHLVKGIRETRHGQIVEFHDGQTALVHLGRHHGLFVDRSESKQVSDIIVEFTGNVDPSRL